MKFAEIDVFFGHLIITGPFKLFESCYKTVMPFNVASVVVLAVYHMIAFVNAKNIGMIYTLFAVSSGAVRLSNFELRASCGNSDLLVALFLGGKSYRKYNFC